MKPGTLSLRVQSRPVCQLCRHISQQPAHRRPFIASTFKAPAIRRQGIKHYGVIPRTPARSITTSARTQELEPETGNHQQWSGRTVSLKTKLAELEKHIEWIKSSPKVESEAATLEALNGLGSIARQAIAIRSGRPPPPKLDIRQSSAGAILSMDRDESDNGASITKTTISKPFTDELPSPLNLSRLAEELLKHPKVFISPNILATYIRLQRILGRPRAIPEILYLYANKPVPELGSSPPKYSKPSPNAAKQAIPGNLASEALTAAIEAKDMPLALDVVQMSYCAPAWKRHRMLTKLGVPSVLAAFTPLAIYTIAQELSVYSNYIDPDMFKLYSFMGLSTYILCTATLGFVALTTHNDHHNRVVWRPGTPLLERYLREDERAALDRIACAWGFKEVWKRGDEEGEEWEGLRQWILLKRMILDKPDLMPGMNA